MLQFLQPLWLWAASGIIIPILIHLWNLQSGKTMKVGSVMLINQTQKQNIRSRVLTEIPLLILRCFLIITLTCLLAQPQWEKSKTTSSKSGWVLLQQSNPKRAYSSSQAQIDSLLAAGFELRLLDSSFTRTELSSIKEKQDTIIQASPPISNWQLIALLDQKLPPGFPVYVYTDNNLKKFDGVRPEVSLSLHWQTFNSQDSSVHLLTAIRKTSDDSIRAFKLNSTSTGNKIAFASYPSQQLNALLDQEKNTAGDVTIDTSAINITLYADKSEPGIAYVQSAIRSVMSYGKFRINLSVIDRAEDMKHGQDWVFWFSPKQIPDNDARNVFQYGSGKPKSIDSWLVSDEIGALTQPIPISRFIESDFNVQASTVWKDGFGHTILSKLSGTQNLYTLNTKFDPAWTELVWNERFPVLLMNLLLDIKQPGSFPDMRSIDETIASPGIVKNTVKSGVNANTAHSDLAKPFWLLAFLLFAMERYISSKKKKANV